MTWLTARKRQLISSLILSTSLLAMAQDAPSSPAKARAATTTQLASDQQLDLASAQTVFLTARVGEVMATVHGRARASAERALTELKKAILEWHRFAIVNSPDKADLILTILESNQNSGLREGVLSEKLLVARGGSTTPEPALLWESSVHKGGVRDYRPVGKTVDEFRTLLDKYDRDLPPDQLAQLRAAKKAKAPSGGCGETKDDPLDCLKNSASAVFLPEDREENKGNVKLSEAVLNVSLLNMEEHISSSEFSDYVIAMQKLLHQQFTATERGPGWDIAVLGTFQPDGKPKLEVQSRPYADQKQLQTFYDKLTSVPGPAVSKGPVDFRVVFAVWGGSEESKKERK